MDFGKKSLDGTSVCKENKEVEMKRIGQSLDPGKRCSVSVPEEDTCLDMELDNEEVPPASQRAGEVTYMDVADRSPESVERCSTPVPEEEDAWEEVLPEDASDNMAGTPPANGDERNFENPNGVTVVMESVRSAPAPKLRGLPGMALAILDDYYKYGPDACRKPQYDAFYNYFPNTESRHVVPRTRNYLDDFIKFIDSGSDVPEPQDHFGYRVLDDSVWTSQSTAHAPLEPEDIENEAEESPLEQIKHPEILRLSRKIEREKKESSTEPNKSSKIAKTPKRRITFIDEVAQLSLTEAPRRGDRDGPGNHMKGNTVLPEPTEKLESRKTAPVGELPETRQNPAELEEQESPQNAPGTSRMPESDEWGEELDYD